MEEEEDDEARKLIDGSYPTRFPYIDKYYIRKVFSVCLYFYSPFPTKLLDAMKFVWLSVKNWYDGG